MAADGGLITRAGKAYDSGRGGSLCAFLFVFSVLFGLLLLLFLSVHSSACMSTARTGDAAVH